ncbi:MAG: hypothetical protein ACE5Q3_13605 [Alphaproteobacteria bacterium]
MEQACRSEVEDLHRFFVEWMSGSLPRTREAFARVTDVIAPGFLIVSPAGVVTERAPLIAELDAAHGRRVNPQAPFRIWIEKYRRRHPMGDLALVTYEEWQSLAGVTTARISTALFRRKAGTPNGVEWLHVHETWLAGHEPAS